MALKISVIGSGYVGLVTGIGLSKLGNQVTFIDIDKEKIDLINQSKPPIYEEGLEELMKEQVGRYQATSDYNQAISNSDITFISVGTPSLDDGSIDLNYIKSSSEALGKALQNKPGYHVVVVKSTVIPGTTEDVIKPIIEKSSGKKIHSDFGLAMNPEFLREGVALKDFFKPDRIVVGVEDEKTKSVLEELYSQFDVPKLFVNLRTAEMIKYTSNAFLAAKISFANEIGNLCKKLGIDTYKVFEGVGLDHRINHQFFRAGVGFGGSCFPKDVKALIYKQEISDEESKILKAAIDVNEAQPVKIIELLKHHLPDLTGQKIGLLGLAFKPDSDDIRESRAGPIVKELLNEGAKIIAYDPQAMNNFKELFPQIEYAISANEVLENTNIIIIQTDWPEFEKLNYSGKTVIDGRRVKKAKETAKVYEGICW